MNKIYQWYQKHTITTHSLASLAVTLSVLYAGVPQFKDLVNTYYAMIPATAKQFVATAIAVYSFYQLRKPSDTTQIQNK